MASRMIRIFVNHANSYHGKHIVRELVRLTDNGAANYRIYASLADLQEIDVDPLDTSILDVLKPADANYFDQVMSCDVIVYDVNNASSQIEEVCQLLGKLRQNFESRLDEKLPLKYFVLISTILTWQQTPSHSKELTDVDYRKRRPHLCFQMHHRLEGQIMVFQNQFIDFIQTVVVCSGVAYGGCEDTFHYLFKMAYMNQDEIKIYEPGNNRIPSIHVQDLAKCVAKVIDQWPDSMIRYILAVQPTPTQYRSFAEAIVQEVGGEDTRIRCCAKESMYRLSQMEYLKLTLNLNLRSNYFEDSQFEYSGEDLATLGKLLAIEYYESRKLGPIKVVIHGPPLSGKSILAAKLSEQYGLHVVTLPGIYEEISNQLKLRVKSAVEYLEYASNSSNDVEEVHEFQTIEKAAKNIGLWKFDNEILKNLQTKDNELSDIEIKFLRQLLGSKPYSHNQGYIIDGFAYRRKYAELVFLGKDEEDTMDDLMKPDLVIILSANDGKLCQNAVELLEDNAEAEFLRKMEIYRDVSQEDESLRNFFLDHDILPMEFNVNETTLEEIFERLQSVLGKPKRYPKPKVEVETERRQIERAVRAEAKKETREKVVALKNMLDNRERRVQKWACGKIQAKRKEIEMLELQGLPAKNYLIEQILPCITDALLEVVKVRPADPIDYLAEKLLKTHSIGQQILKSQNLNYKP